MSERQTRPPLLYTPFSVSSLSSVPTLAATRVSTRTGSHPVHRRRLQRPNRLSGHTETSSDDTLAPGVLVVRHPRYGSHPRLPKPSPPPLHLEGTHEVFDRSWTGGWESVRQDRSLSHLRRSICSLLSGKSLGNKGSFNLPSSLDLLSPPILSSRWRKRETWFRRTDVGPGTLPPPPSP